MHTHPDLSNPTLEPITIKLLTKSSWWQEPTVPRFACKAIMLFSTSPQTLSLKFNLAPVQRPNFNISLIHYPEIKVFKTSYKKAKFLLFSQIYVWNLWSQLLKSLGHACLKNMGLPVQFLDQEHSLEEEMVVSCIILAWEIPWTEEPGRLQSLGSQRVWHDSAHLLKSSVNE